MAQRPMSDQEHAAIEKLKQGYEPAWNQFIEAVGEPLHRRLVEFSGGDQEKAEDYLSEILLLLVRAIGKIK